MTIAYSIKVQFIHDCLDTIKGYEGIRSASFEDQISTQADGSYIWSGCIFINRRTVVLRNQAASTPKKAENTGIDRMISDMFMMGVISARKQLLDPWFERKQ
jgi:hypothetical protein